MELVTPVTLDVALQVQAELTARAEHADAWHAQAVQRAREDADLARQRYMQADPDHRLVADVLEAEWNAKLRALNDAQDELERRRAANRAQLSDEQRRQILALATDFPRLWNDPRTPHRERKRMARLLIQDVTLTRGGVLAVGVRLRGGATRQLTVQPELPAYKRRQTAAEAIADIDELLDRHTEGQIAAILNRRGRHSGSVRRRTCRRADSRPPFVSVTERHAPCCDQMLDRRTKRPSTERPFCGSLCRTGRGCRHGSGIGTPIPAIGARDCGGQLPSNLTPRPTMDGARRGASSFHGRGASADSPRAHRP